MVARSGARVVNVYGPGPEVAFDTPGAEIAAFEKEMEKCKAEGINVRAIVSVPPPTDLPSSSSFLLGFWSFHSPLSYFLLPIFNLLS